MQFMRPGSRRATLSVFPVSAFRRQTWAASFAVRPTTSSRLLRANAHARRTPPARIDDAATERSIAPDATCQVLIVPSSETETTCDEYELKSSERTARVCPVNVRSRLSDWHFQTRIFASSPVVANMSPALLKTTAR
eukprot:Amastigsp_a514953_97.p3 type:complete len:137 gc:universal Amastigsp_a514953_97:312-722(+)